jgi:hypothetical protein
MAIPNNAMPPSCHLGFKILLICLPESSIAETDQRGNRVFLPYG